MNETTKTAPPDDRTSEPQYWAVIPSPVRYDENLTPSEKLLYGEISSLTNKTGYCFAANAYFAELYGLTERTIRRMLADLQENGYIRIEDGNGGRLRRRIYAGVNPISPAAPNPDKNVREPGQKCPGNPDKNVPHNKKENKKENNPPKAPQGAGADFVPKEAPDWKPERFSAFWNFYPLHKSKQATIRAWDKLKPSDELLAVIGKALMRQIAEKKQEAERSRKPFEWKMYASTYLNGARWTDEAEEPMPVDEPAYTGRKDLVQL